MHVGEILVTAAIGFVLIGVAGYLLSIYNGLVSLRNNISRSWSNIDVLLKQRHDELPKLVQTCQGYMQHERAVFDNLSAARGAILSAKTVGQRAEAEGQVTQALGRLFAVAEAYPDLKANQSFLQLQSRISDLENQIADRREFYNDVVTTFNTRIESIPDKYVAGSMALVPAEWFKATDADREDPKIEFKMAG
ncbi:MAG: LemA family protein [Candidatus Eisenbacteria bacterium]